MMAVENNIDRHNANGKPFFWAAKATDALEKSSSVRRLWISVIRHDTLH
jgi:hypothetical protein